MASRRDALQGAAGIMQEVVAIATRHALHGRGTVGMVQVMPNSRNVIPGQVKFSIDLRNASSMLLDVMDAELRACVDAVRSHAGLEITLEQASHFAPCPFDGDCVDTVRRAASSLGYATMDVVSGAGHDAIYAAPVAPAGMIFVPCRDGVCHNEIEDAEPEHLEAGASVLLQGVLHADGVDAG